MSSKKNKDKDSDETRQPGLSTIEPPPQNKAVMQGWLKKKSPKTIFGVNMWQKRYFFLEQSRLLYFKNKPHDKHKEKQKDAALSCLGALNIELIASVEKIKRQPLRFNIYLHESGRVFELWADSNLNVTFWCDALARVGIPVTSSIDGNNNTSPRNSIKKRDSKDQGVVKTTEKFWKAKNYNARRRAITVGSSFRATSPPAGAAQHTQKTEKQTQFILDSIKKSVAFEKLDVDLQKQVVEKMWSMKSPKGTALIKIDERGDLFYVLESGTIDILSRKSETDEKEEKTDAKGPGACFGELSIMYNAVSTMTFAVSSSEALLWAVDRSSYRNVVKAVTEKKLKMYEDFLMKSKIIGALSMDTIGKVAEALEEKQFADGAKIVSQGEEGEVFYLIRTGECHIQVDGHEVGKYQSGDSFGMAKDKNKTATIIAKGPVTTLCLDKVSFGLLLSPLEKYLTKEQDWYNTVSAAELAKLRHAEEEKQKSTSAAQAALLASAKEAVAAASPTTATPTPVATTTTSTPTTTASTETTSAPASTPAPTSAPAETPAPTATQGGPASTTTAAAAANHLELSAPPKRKLDISELKVIGTLGKGTFGHVQLVEDKEGGTYALKMMAKSHIVKHNQQDHIVSERRVMEGLDHPFIIKMYQTMKDSNFVYLLLEVNLGGELFSVLRSRGKFDENTARFYAAGVVLAFEYMHDLNIVYRDLKPENLLLDEVGYLKITDFGSAKKIKNRTWTFCGTPDYLAPEIISSTGHGKGVDWWTLGVLIYEMLAGYSPFCADEVAKIYDRILDGDLVFPNHFTPEAKSIVSSLLELKPTKRLGVLNGGATLIKEHAWFKGFDWEKFIRKQLKAPIPTNIKNKYDLSNFDDYGPADQLEEYDPRDYPGVDPEWDKEF